jgi:hypothetical protein
MAKEGSGFAASVWKARRSALNSAAPFPGPEVAQERVLGIQRKLHKWAEDDQDRRFKDLHNLVCDPATLMVAWQRVRAGAATERQPLIQLERRDAEVEVVQDHLKRAGLLDDALNPIDHGPLITRSVMSTIVSGQRSAFIARRPRTGPPRPRRR